MNSPDLREDQHSIISWLILAGVAAPLEVYLLVVRKNSLSEQMRYWIRYSPGGSVLMMFWIWVAVHFIAEPVVRKVTVLMREI